MKTIFEADERDHLIQRISFLNENTKPDWGKMNVFQMLSHCIKWEEMALGKQTYKQTFLGKIFGRWALKDSLKNETPFKRNIPTIPEFKIKEKTGDVKAHKENWINLINEYEHFSNDRLIHPFFGPITKEQLGYLAYKHSDHHLRQFNA